MNNQYVINFSEKICIFAEQFPDHTNHVAEIENDFLTELQRIEADEQHLSIGIMGQVKAGKSSFLNALLFDGKPILPEAATPKTANLTRIAYGEHPHLTVHYYSPQEWQEIEDDAKGGSDSPRARVAKDLVAMVQHHGIDAAALLGRVLRHGDERRQGHSGRQGCRFQPAFEHLKFPLLIAATGCGCADRRSCRSGRSRG